MRPTDLALLRTPGVADRLAGRPDGRRRRGPARPRGRRVPQPALGGAHRRLGAGPAADQRRTGTARPAFSPDGRWLAYLSAEPGGKPQVHVLPTAGGAPRRLTDHHLGAGAPVWSPDSRRLAYTARVPEQGRYGTVEGVGPAAEPPRLITTLQYRLDDVGFLTDRRSQVFVLDLPGRRRRRHRAAAGTGPGDHGRRRLHRRHLASRRRASSPSSPPATRGPTATWSATSTPSRVDGSGAAPGHRRPRGDCALPAYAPDGSAGRHRGPRPRPRRAGLRRPAAGALPGGPDGGALRPLLDPEQHHRGDDTPATVVVDGAVLVGVQRRGAVELLRVPLDGGRAGDAGRRARSPCAASRRRRRRRRRGGPRPVRGGADRDHPGPPAAADRVRPAAGGDRPACTA